MKTAINLIGIIALSAIIGFTIAACGDGGGNDDDKNKNTPTTPATPQPFADITAVQLVANIKIGWNLGNTLDACDHGEGWMPKSWTVNQMETAWNSPPVCTIPTTTKAMITAIKNAGFNAIRIPVTWYKVVDANYNIRADWMARVTEIVNYAVDNDMYIILNSHHDEHIFMLSNAKIDASLAAYKKIWEQIADSFKNYNEKLIFEGLNEPRTIGSSNEWNGGTAAEHTNLNKYYPVFIQAVRDSGGNNDKRFLIVTTYAQSSAQVALDALTIPGDTASNKLIVSIHAYEPYSFALDSNGIKTWSESNPSDKSGVTDPIDRAYNKFVSNGTPVIIGEFGAWDKNNETARAAWAKFYVSYAKSKGIPCFWWDGSDVYKLFNRTNNTFAFPEILTALMEGAEGLSTPPPTGEGTAAVFSSWTTGKDDSSSITYAETSGKHRIYGNIAAGEGDHYANIAATPNAATLAKMKTMTSFSFKVSGDGNQYDVMVSTSDTVSAGYNHYRKSFTATGTETTITVTVASLAQADWGGAGIAPFTKNNIIEFQFQRVGNGSFDLTVSDITLYQ